MLHNIRHTGLVVRNVQKSRVFYEGLGFVVEKHAVESGAFISHVVGIQNAKIETIKMKTLDGGMIELLQYTPTNQREPAQKQPSNQLGCSHIAMTVSSIDEFCNRIEMLGGSIVNSPRRSEDGKVSVVYCHDDDGILLEIVEEHN